MDMHRKFNKKWWLYGALTSFVIAIVGVLLLFFVFNGGKKRHIDDDDEEDEEQVDEVKVREMADWDEEPINKDNETQIDDIQVDDKLSDSNPSRVEQHFPACYLVEHHPTFPEGDPRVWIAQHLRYPADLDVTDVQGIVVCQFVIEPDGSISNVKVVRSVYPSLDREAVRVIKSMPKWDPGTLDGEPIRSKYTLPIKFQLQ